MLLPLLLLPFLALARATTYTLNHRHSSESSFTRYGTIDLPEDRDVNEIIRIDKATAGDLVGQGEGWYQVKMEGEGLGAGLLSSTKSCYLNAGPITLVINTHPKGISSIDLIPHLSVPSDGSCPIGRSGTTSTGTGSITREVVIKTPHLVYGPDLSPPPPPSVSPDGKPIVPEVEKSFLQKYWLPLLGVGFFVISQMAPEEKKAPAK